MYKSTTALPSFFLFLLGIILPSIVFAQNPDIVGRTTSEEVREQHPVFDIYTKRYAPNKEAIEYLSSIQDTIRIYVLFGTWCHDSKKQIPAFMKTLELADNPIIGVEYIAVTKQKTDPENLAQRWDLKYTPTFIIYRRNKEYGRIIEEPEISLEEDLARILKSEPVLKK